MKKIELSGQWQMSGNQYTCTGTVPGSVYSFLLENGLMDDPYFRQNEISATKLADSDYTFTRSFSFNNPGEAALLCCEGLDTLCDIYINGTFVGHTQNMHRRYEFSVGGLLRFENEIKLIFRSANKFFKEANKINPTPENRETLVGYSHLRKSFCMSGWDWAPQLPDAGIWRDIYLLVGNTDRIKEVRITQRHENGRVWITPRVLTEKDCSEVRITLTSPDKEEIKIPVNSETEISAPKLWWPNGLGEQNLYTLTVTLSENNHVVDTCVKTIGLRTLNLVREKDQYGESFCHEINGIRFFAMGADYIPEDCILSRITPERTRKLLTYCKNCNFNAIRVWGGGNYPNDDFYDTCDRLGLVVFNDLMIACTTFPIDDELTDEFTEEVRENLIRIRHHACIAIICGNNECEWHQVNTSKAYKERYLLIYENLLPEIVKEVCPEIAYVPSSPSSCGHFIDPNNENYGDSHYWEVWHNEKPFTEYRKHYFRYLSEFGFESMPNEKTVNSFTLPSDRNIFSRVMEMHQRNADGNRKIISYIAQTYKYPTDFSTLIYASQLLQAQAIKYGVEHLRRNRGRCMGALYWQLNDTWPVISWSSIDYGGCFKALQYVSKRFFAPILISCCETGETATRPCVTLEQEVYPYETKAQFAVTNDTLRTSTGMVSWRLCKNDGSVLQSGTFEAEVKSLSVTILDEIKFSDIDIENNYLWYEYSDCNYGGSVIFTAPKHYHFVDPELSVSRNGNTISVTAQNYAQMVELYSSTENFVLSDNFFDMEPGTRTVEILEGNPCDIMVRSVFDI